MRQLLILLFLACLGATPEPAIVAPSGIYGNVRMSAETGDLGGYEIRFFTDPATAKPMLEFVSCAGWCNETYILPLMQDEKGYWFEYVENDKNEAGKPVPGAAFRYHLQRKGKNLILKGFVTSCADCDPFGPYKLKPLKQIFGIKVGNQAP